MAKSMQSLDQLDFGTNTTPVAGVSKVGGLKRSSDAIEYKEGGNSIILKGLGRTKYDAITLERGITHDSDFQDWADAAQVLDKGAPRQSLKNLRGRFGLNCSTKKGSLLTATSSTVVGCQSIRPFPISMLAATR